MSPRASCSAMVFFDHRRAPAGQPLWAHAPSTPAETSSATSQMGPPSNTDTCCAMGNSLKSTTPGSAPPSRLGLTMRGTLPDHTLTRLGAKVVSSSRMGHSATSVFPAVSVPPYMGPRTMGGGWVTRKCHLTVPSTASFGTNPATSNRLSFRASRARSRGGLTSAGTSWDSFPHTDNVQECGEVPTHGFLLRNGEYTQIDFPRSTSTRVLGPLRRQAR